MSAEVRQNSCSRVPDSRKALIDMTARDFDWHFTTLITYFWNKINYGK